MFEEEIPITNSDIIKVSKISPSFKTVVECSKSIPHDFKIITNNNTYECHLLLAATCSSVILNAAMESEEPLYEFRYNGDDTFFDQVAMFFNGENIEITNENANYIQSVFEDFGIDINIEIRINSIISIRSKAFNFPQTLKCLQPNFIIKVRHKEQAVHRLTAQIFCKAIKDFSVPFQIQKDVNIEETVNYLNGGNVTINYENIDEIEESANLLQITQIINPLKFIRPRLSKVMSTFIYSNLQEYINSIDPKTIETVLNTIKQSRFFLNESYHHDLSISILTASTVRPLNNNEHLMFIKDLCSISDHFHDELIQVIVTMTISKLLSFYFLRQLYLHEIVNITFIEELYKKINIIKKEFYSHDSYPFEIWFPDELKLEPIDSMNSRLRNNPNYFVDFYHNNKDEYINQINYGFRNDEYSNAIRNDDVTELQTVLEHNNFDFNQKLEQNIFERSLFIQGSVTLIQIACFYGSIKCFKYLKINGASIEQCSKFAACSGNIEILRILHQEKCNFKEALNTSIMFHQNEVFKWISSFCHENYYSKIDLDRFSYNYHTNNLINTSINYNNLCAFLMFYQYGIDLKVCPEIVVNICNNGLLHFLELYITIYGNDINYLSKDLHGAPVYFAVKCLAKDCVMFLVKEVFKTPFELALKYGANEIVEFLEPYMEINGIVK